MKLHALVKTLNDLAPLQYAESWDNVGLLAGDPNEQVTKALLTVDMTLPVINEARAIGCQLVIAYHPPIFDGLKRINAYSPVGVALRHGIAIYSPHTALDAAIGGTNDYLADIAEMQTRAPIRPVSKPGDHVNQAASAATNSIDHIGMGRIGVVAPVTCAALIERVKHGLGIKKVLVAGPIDRTIEKVAVAAGAAGDLLKEARRLGADAVITGEVRHHDALAAAAAGVIVICTLHSCSERNALGPFRDRLSQRHPAVQFLASECDEDPFQFV
jgi:dinuclear metal center YbgI/SA1388 family protein